MERAIGLAGGLAIAAGAAVAAVLPPSPLAPATAAAVRGLPGRVAELERRAGIVVAGLVPARIPASDPRVTSREPGQVALRATVIAWYPPPTHVIALSTVASDGGRRATTIAFPPTPTIPPTTEPWPTTTAIAPLATVPLADTSLPPASALATAVPETPTAVTIAATVAAVPPSATVRTVAAPARTSLGGTPSLPPPAPAEEGQGVGVSVGPEAPFPTPTTVGRARTEVSPRIDAALLEAIRASLPINPEAVAVSVTHLESGASAGLNDDRMSIPASLYKVGVLAEAFRQIEAGSLRTDEPLRLVPDDWAPGAGILQGRIGSQVTVADALRLMIGISDNVAAHAIVRRVGADRVNANNQRLGLGSTRYYTDSRPDSTTAADMARLLSLLAQGKVAGAEATARMIDLMRQAQPVAWLPRGLPNSVPVAHKSGQLAAVRNDAGIVFGPTGPYVLVVLTDNRQNARLGESAIVEVARTVHAYFAAGG